MNRKIEHLIVDAAGFLKNVQLQELAENIYTIQEVVSEIRDSATRQRLAVLPYDIRFKTPSSDSIIHVSDFAKKTGDWGSLSATDVKVMALTYQLTGEIIGFEHLNEVPEKKMTIKCSKKPLQKATDIAGFYFPEKKNTEKVVEKSGDNNTDSSLDVKDLSLDVKDSTLDVKDSSLDVKDSSLDIKDLSLDKDSSLDVKDSSLDVKDSSLDVKDSVLDVKDSSLDVKDSSLDVKDSSLDVKDSSLDVKDSINDQINESVQEVEDNKKQLNENNENNTMEENDELVDNNTEMMQGLIDEEDTVNDEEDDDDNVGWITPNNISQVKSHIESDQTAASDVKVGCLTTDFAMQNVLIQIGLSVVSVDGFLIKKAKSYALRCYSCFKITSNTSKVFCPKCGNKTLTKVTVTVDEDGTQRYHLSSRRAINTRGLKYPIPLPKGGKHATNPVLVEDQPMPQNRPAKKTMANISAFDPDYVARGSPFTTNDVTSRAAQLGVRSSGGNSSRRRNPNEVRHKKGRKK